MTSILTAPPAAAKPQTLIYNNKAYKHVETPLYTGYMLDASTEVSSKEPTFKWRGGKMPFELWGQVVSFLRWTQLTFKEEAMVTFFYHLETKEWAAWAFPQEPNGMAIKKLPDHPRARQDRQRFGRGWVEFGSVHHHCTAGAFASGVDDADEQDREGLHVTLGKMEDDTLDIHCRGILDGIRFLTHLFDWVEMPEYLKAAPLNCRYEWFATLLARIDDVQYPEEWEANVIKLPTGYRGNSYTEAQWIAEGWEKTSTGWRLKESKKNESGDSGGNDNSHLGIRNDTSNDGGSSSPAHPATAAYEFRGRKAKEIAAILLKLEIDSKEAFGLLSMPASEMTAMPDIDRLVRNALIREIGKTNSTLMYIEDILEEYLQNGEVGGVDIDEMMEELALRQEIAEEQDRIETEITHQQQHQHREEFS